MKVAMYIEQKIKKTGEIAGWVGYAYSEEVSTQEGYRFKRNGKDQWGNTVRVYEAKDTLTLDSPGGVHKTNEVVLYEKEPLPKGVK